MSLFKHHIKGQPVTIIDLNILHAIHRRFRLFSKGLSQGFVKEFPLIPGEFVEIYNDTFLIN